MLFSFLCLAHSLIHKGNHKGLPLQNPTVCRGNALVVALNGDVLVPTLCVGMPAWTLRVLHQS